MSKRIAQINSALHQDIAEYTSRTVSSGKSLVTVTYVSATPDISQAEVGITTFPAGNEMIESIIRLLMKNKSELQLSIARKHNLKSIPVLHFVSDINQDKVTRIDELMHTIEHERS